MSQESQLRPLYSTAEEWKAGREAIDEYENSMLTDPHSCALFEQVISSFAEDSRIQRWDIMRKLMFSLNVIHVTHDDPTKHSGI